MSNSYFSKNHENVAIRLEKRTGDGLRASQYGAIHAIASYYTINDSDAAMIAMPTGTGKTTVITMTPFILKVRRVLVITSSILVRGQIAEDFKKLKSLNYLNLFSGKNFPVVFERRKSIKDEDLKRLKTADVVIGIPPALDTLFDSEFKCPDDYFDLILVDEAHHKPAVTWEKVINRFPLAKKVYFTATPFRRDKKSLRGKLIYNYPLSRAKEDKSFAPIEFKPVKGFRTEDEADLGIAKLTEKVFKEDRKNGLKHSIMVRTNTKENVSKLIKLYEENTSLRLVEVSSSKTHKHIQATIKRLMNDEIDGVICVNMLGEGFDFPRLKIAAIHKPHKSEAITLQFIGRFTRTNDKTIGSAKFIATIHDIEIGKQRLFQEDSVWGDMIVNISEMKVKGELEEQDVVESFESLEDNEGESELSLYNLFPFCHVKIYSVKDVNLETEIQLGQQIVIKRSLSREKNLLIVVTKLETKPKWIVSDRVRDCEYFLYIVYYDESSQLLFVNSTLKSNDTYEQIFQSVTGLQESGFKYQIPKSKIHRVLLDLKETSFFSIGMQNKNPSSGESYKTTTGSDTQNVIRKGDGMLYSNGHMFCRAKDGGTAITVGYSSASKVWSNSYLRISDFLSWCRGIALKVSSERTVKTNSPYDHIPVPQVIKTIGSKIITADWNVEIYKNFPTILTNKGEVHLTDFSLEVIPNRNRELVEVHLINDERKLKIPLLYSIDHGWRNKDQSQCDFTMDPDEKFINFINEYPIILRNSDFDTLEGNEMTKGFLDESVYIEQAQLDAIDWNALGVDVQIEFGHKTSIHEGLKRFFLTKKCDVLIYDHGSGEIADLIILNKNKDHVKIELYHVKKATGAGPADRLNDLYEVCGQSVKSVQYLANKQALVRKFTGRLSGKSNKFLKGDIVKVLGLIQGNLPFRFEIVIVQPAVSKKDISGKLGVLLASSDMFLRSTGGFEPLRVMCSN